MTRETPLPRFFLALIVAVALLLGLVLVPIIKELFLAAVFAGALWPVQRWLTRKLRGKRGLAAGLLTAGVVVLLVGPVAMMVTFIVRDGADGLRFVSDAVRSEEVADLVEYLPAASREFVSDAIDRLPRDLDEIMGHMDGHGGQAAAAIGKALAATGSIAFHTILMLIALFFLLVRGDELVKWLDSVSPLRRGQTQELFAAFKRVSFAVIASAGITAAAQAAAALVGFSSRRSPIRSSLPWSRSFWHSFPPSAPRSSPCSPLCSSS